MEAAKLVELEEMSDSLESHKKAFERKGGKVQRIEPRQAGGLNHGSKKGGQAVSGKTLLSGYERERPPKSESLAVRMNLRSPDPQSVSGTQRAEISQGDIYAALTMGNLTKFEQELFIYYATEDPRSRSSAWSLLMTELADRVNREDWGTRKRGILIAMSNTVLEQLVNPNRFRGISGRQMSRKLDLGHHSQWKAYSPRYDSLLGYAREIIERAEQILVDQI